VKIERLQQGPDLDRADIQRIVCLIINLELALFVFFCDLLQLASCLILGIEQFREALAGFVDLPIRKAPTLRG
jgi:hypothetical protein